MKLKHLSLGWVVLLLCSAFVSAQTAPAPTSTGAPTKNLYSKLSDIFSGPLHPIFKGVASTGGFGAGLEYDFPTVGRWETTAKALVTVRRYWSMQLDTVYRGDRVAVEGYARMREMSQLSYFGPGINSEVRNRTSFLLKDPVVGAVATIQAAPWMAVGGRVEAIWPDVGSGRSAIYPTIDTTFGAGDAPGLIEQPRFGRYQGFVEFQAPDSVGQAFNQGGRYRITYQRFDDQQFDRFTFDRLDLEARHKFALFGPYRRLTLRAWVATTDTAADHEVPFYLQPTLGGNGQIRSVDDDLIGADGSRGTLRGFRDYRFRDRNLLLLQAEYRVPIWGPFDASVFVDAGKVASRPEDLNLSDPKRNFGVSLSVMRGPVALARTDLGFGGGEGTKLSVSFGVAGDVLGRK